MAKSENSTSDLGVLFYNLPLRFLTLLSEGLNLDAKLHEKAF